MSFLQTISANSLLRWSNITYLSGTLLAVVSAILSLTPNSLKSKRTSAFAVFAALLSCLGSFGVIREGQQVSHLKDAELAEVLAASARLVADANKDAQIAKLGTEQIRKKNLGLEVRLGRYSGKLDSTQLALAGVEDATFHRELLLTDQELDRLRVVGHPRIVISVDPEDKESMHLANSLATAFYLDPNRTFNFVSGGERSAQQPLGSLGVHIRHLGADHQSFIGVLQRMLSNHGIISDVELMNSFDTDVYPNQIKDVERSMVFSHVLIYIGPNPNRRK